MEGQYTPLAKTLRFAEGSTKSILKLPGLRSLKSPVSVAGSDGRPVRYGADKDVLSSVVSIDSVGGFYAIGANRIVLLDIALLLALLGGLSVPIAHMIWGRLLKRHLAKQADKSA